MRQLHSDPPTNKTQMPVTRPASKTPMQSALDGLRRASADKSLREDHRLECYQMALEIKDIMREHDHDREAAALATITEDDGA